MTDKGHTAASASISLLRRIWRTLTWLAGWYIRVAVGPVTVIAKFVTGSLIEGPPPGRSHFGMWNDFASELRGALGFSALLLLSTGWLYLKLTRRI